VKISLTGSGCSACHNSLCMLGDSKAKQIEVAARKEPFYAGEEVIVKINPASGYKAVALLYLVPFVCMMATLMGMLQAGYPEGIAGMSSLLILAPYFFILYQFKQTLSNQCTIDVIKK